MRIYEFAKNSGVSSSELLDLLRAAGFLVKSHMSVLDEKEILFLQKHFTQQAKVMTENLKQTQSKKNSPIEKIEKEDVILSSIDNLNKKDSKNIPELSEKNFISHPFVDEIDEELLLEDEDSTEEFYFDEDNEFDEDPSEAKKRKKRQFGRGVSEDSFAVKRKKRRRRTSKNAKNVDSSSKLVLPKELNRGTSCTVAQISKISGLSPMQTVMFFLRKGLALSFNDVVSADDVEKFAPELGITLKDVSIDSGYQKNLNSDAVAVDKFIRRPPVVVIMGHVDHGKTTLIDYILRSNIAGKEKGGITQTIRVHEVKTKHGEFLLIDTPGHEAFSLMRTVGAKITDIAVIVVAADDGIKQQTIESINTAKAMGATVFVAINKMDKEGVAANVDKIKQELARYDLIVEEWGGSTVCMPISAKTGLGVDDFFDMISLQAELLDLKALTSVAARAFVLESFIEKGLGICATILLTEGELKIGDNFAVGKNFGRVKVIFDQKSGQRVSVLRPYHAAKIVGFTEMVSSGEELKFVPLSDLTQIKRADNLSVEEKTLPFNLSQQNSSSIKVVLKADSFAVLDALSGLIASLEHKNQKFKGMIQVMASSVGNIYEKDVEIASANGAIILGMNVSVEKKAAEMARIDKVEIKVDAIIYRLSEYLESLVITKLKSMFELKQVGKGFVKKVFDIRGRGVIAGCAITEGNFIDKAIVHALRAGVKIGEGRVVSLQQNKKTMKEVGEGQDCGFICQGFSAWQEGDRVVCFVEIPLA